MKSLCKALLFILMLPHSYSGIRAQASNYKITYRHCIQFDSAQTLTDTLGMEAVLIGNDKTSNYVFAKLPKELWGDSLKVTPDVIMDQSSDGGTITRTEVAPGTKYDAFGSMLFYDKKKDSVFAREKMPNNYVITKEATPVIRWIIANEFKKIQGYKCQKATAQFRGRNYEAWYTTELAIMDGPWKFKNLPGLVLQIEDAAKQVKLYAVNIEKKANESVAEFVDRGKPISMTEYVGFRNITMRAQFLELKEMSRQKMSQLTGVIVSDESSDNYSFYGIEKRLE